jgi:3-methyl-2-oxobutanoate hydroxymethyltransferase
MSNDKVSLLTLNKKKQVREKLVMITTYDASFAKVVDEAQVEMILVGDSLGNVIQGRESTVPVTVEDIAYHTECVKRGTSKALIISDMPFMSYATLDRALFSAEKFMQAGGEMVKMEGGEWLCESVRRLSDNGIPCCGHLGLQPQSVNFIGGFRVQGRDTAVAKKIMQDSLLLQEAGAKLLVLECVPRILAEEIAKTLTIPVIGIGAGENCDGQVLVIYDLLGIGKQPLPKFVKNFMEGNTSILAAVKAYVREVKEGIFPNQQYGFD